MMFFRRLSTLFQKTWGGDLDCLDTAWNTIDCKQHYPWTWEPAWYRPWRGEEQQLMYNGLSFATEIHSCKKDHIVLHVIIAQGDLTFNFNF